MFSIQRSYVARRQRYGILADILVIGLLLLLVHIPALLIPEMPGLPRGQDVREFIFNLWQVAAATVAIALVILLLIIESVHRSDERDLVWGKFSTDPLLSLSLTFFLSVIVAIGVGGLAFLPKSNDSLPTPPGMGNLLILDFVLFTLAIIVILFLYARMFSYMSPQFARGVARQYLLQSVRVSVAETVRARIRSRVMREECELLGLSWDEGMTDLGNLTRVLSDKDGRILDINLSHLRRLPTLLTSRQNPRARLCGSVGSRVRAGESVLALIYSDDDCKAVIFHARSCFRIEASNEG